jgi:hypothetical protein
MITSAASAIVLKSSLFIALPSCPFVATGLAKCVTVQHFTNTPFLAPFAARGCFQCVMAFAKNLKSMARVSPVRHHAFWQSVFNVSHFRFLLCAD